MQNINVPEEVKDFIKRILVLDPKQRMSVKEMFEHPFLKNEDIPQYIPVEAYLSLHSGSPLSRTSSPTVDHRRHSTG